MGERCTLLVPDLRRAIVTLFGIRGEVTDRKLADGLKKLRARSGKQRRPYFALKDRGLRPTPLPSRVKKGAGSRSP